MLRAVMDLFLNWLGSRTSASPLTTESLTHDDPLAGLCFPQEFTCEDAVVLSYDVMSIIELEHVMVG